MSVSKRSWNLAATAMLIGKFEFKGACRFKILMLKRSSKSKFFPETYVFPGGKLSASDTHPEWLRLIPHTNFNNLLVRENKPSVFNEPSPIPLEIALRVCAIRETFEETGLLLHRKSGVSEVLTERDDPGLSEWRSKVSSDDSAFLEMCLTRSLEPDISNLYEWSDWLTPTHMESFHNNRRYDTLFYLAQVQVQSEFSLQEREVTKGKWFTPSEILNEHRSGKLGLAPPQLYELSRLAKFDLWQDLISFAHKRQCQGCHLWMPVRITCADGIIAVLPGDDLYPSEPDWDGVNPAPVIGQTMRESRDQCEHINRFEFTKPNCEVFCTIPPVTGHVHIISGL